MKAVINIDGGSRGNPGFGAAGYVIKDARGQTLKQAGVFLGVCTNNFAEFTALSLALSEAKKLHAAELEIFSDSLLLVKQYAGEYKIKSPGLVELMAEIRGKARGFKTVRLNHVPREKNKEADKLVNRAMDAALKPSVDKMKKEAEDKAEVIINHLAAPEEKPVKNKSGPEQLELF